MAVPSMANSWSQRSNAFRLNSKSWPRSLKTLVLVEERSSLELSVGVVGADGVGVLRGAPEVPLVEKRFTEVDGDCCIVFVQL